jgi:ATP-dependent Clp protease ATP-binding subunit ClpB
MSLAAGRWSLALQILCQRPTTKDQRPKQKSEVTKDTIIMAIRWDKLTVKAQEAVQKANDIASEHGNPELQPLHLLAALASDAEGIIVPVLQKAGANPQTVLAAATADIERLPKVSGGGATQASLSPAAQKVLDQAFK